MSFGEKIKQAIRSFMAGRNGTDQLSMTLVWAGLILYVLSGIANLAFLNLLGLAAYAIAIFRVFSRNRVKRGAENRAFLNWKNRMKTKQKQAKVRFKNRKQYKYFKCPGCKAWLKLPKGTGVATVTCSRCQNSFTQKA